MFEFVRRRAYQAEQGFSLIEVMVTLLVVSVGMLALGSFYVSSMQSERVSQERVAAVHLAEQILEDWQNTNSNPTPDCQIAGVAAGALVVGAEISSCVMNNGIRTPFNILINEFPAKAPVPKGHPSHSGATTAPEMGVLLQDPANAASSPVNVRTVRVSWTVTGKTRKVLLTHITRKP